MTDTRPFPLSDILSVTTGRLLSRRHMDGLYELLNYMTGDDLMTHQLPRAVDTCGPALLDQHPQLRGVEPSYDIAVPDLTAWLTNAELKHGETLPITPVPAGMWDQQDPIEELCDMVGPEKVIVVDMRGDGS
jgi:hypothetical protein